VHFWRFLLTLPQLKNFLKILDANFVPKFDVSVLRYRLEKKQSESNTAVCKLCITVSMQMYERNNSQKDRT